MGKQWKQWEILGGFKITADGNWSHEIKRRLLLGRKAMTNLDSLLKSRGVTLPTQVHLSQSYGFSSCHLWMWKLDYKEIWAPKNWCFWTVVLGLLRVPWTARRSNQSILKQISPEYSLEYWYWTDALMHWTDAEAKTPILWPDSLKKTLIWERLKSGEGDDRGWNGWMASPTQWTWVWASSRREWRTGMPGVLQSMRSQRVGQDWATEQQQEHAVKILSIN